MEVREKTLRIRTKGIRRGRICRVAVVLEQSLVEWGETYSFYIAGDGTPRKNSYRTRYAWTSTERLEKDTVEVDSAALLAYHEIETNREKTWGEKMEALKQFRIKHGVEV